MNVVPFTKQNVETVERDVLSGLFFSGKGSIETQSKSGQVLRAVEKKKIELVEHFLMRVQSLTPVHDWLCLAALLSTHHSLYMMRV